MRDKIISVEKAITYSEELKLLGKKVVLVGGCFDILHIGHITFLQKAKEQGDFLFVLLESDEFITKAKGPNKPINNQKDRARILATLSIVDYVIMLPRIFVDEEYDELVLQLKPAIIATTKGDPHAAHKKRQARQAGSRIITVTDPIANKSTSRIAQVIEKDL